MANLLVTGGAGFIGTSFVNFWHRSNPHDKVVVLDALTYAGNKKNLVNIINEQWFEFVHGSICDQGLVELANQRWGNQNQPMFENDPIHYRQDVEPELGIR